MDKKQFCEWCNREIKEGQKIIDCGNDDVGSLPYHENCYERAKDKLGQ